MHGLKIRSHNKALVASNGDHQHRTYKCISSLEEAGPTRLKVAHCPQLCVSLSNLYTFHCIDRIYISGILF